MGSLTRDKKLKLKINNVSTKGLEFVRIYPPNTDKEAMVYCLQGIKNNLPRVLLAPSVTLDVLFAHLHGCSVPPQVIVKGIPTVSRAIINDQGKGEPAMCQPV